MQQVSEVDFAQIWEYLRKVISPTTTLGCSNHLPDVATPNHEDVIRFYGKHYPQRSAPAIAAIEEGYEWIWNEFKIKAEVKILDLERNERVRFVKTIADFFKSLENDKDAYVAFLEPLQAFGDKMATEWPDDDEDMPKLLLPYYGTHPQRQAKALQNAIWIINEGRALFDSFLNEHKSSATQAHQTPTPKAAEQELSARERTLIICYEERMVINKGEPNYKHYITFTTPKKRIAYANASLNKARSLVKSIRKILLHLSEAAAQRANGEINTIEI